MDFLIFLVVASPVLFIIGLMMYVEVRLSRKRNE